MSKAKPYPTDLTDQEWAIIAPLLPTHQRGRRRKYRLRDIRGAIFYLDRSGCSWRMLPRDLPPWGSVYYYLAQWRDYGLLETINATLRRQLRTLEGHDPAQSIAILDSQCRKKGVYGYDGAKHQVGRKRHLLVDSLGWLLVAVVHTAALPERDGAKLVLQRALDQASAKLQTVFADAGYSGQPMQDWAVDNCGWLFESIKRSERPAAGEYKFEVQQHRWKVERTFGWLRHWRRLNRDYERLTSTSETMVRIATSRLMHTQLTRTLLS